MSSFWDRVDKEIEEMKIIEGGVYQCNICGRRGGQLLRLFEGDHETQTELCKICLLRGVKMLEEREKTNR